MKALLPLKRWWQSRTGEEETPLDGDSPAWALSVVVNLSVLLVLAVIPLETTKTAVDLTVTSFADVEEEAILDSVSFSEEQHDKVGAESMSGEAAAFSLAPTVDEVSTAPLLEIEPSPVATLDASVSLDIPTGLTLNNTMAVKGASGVGATGASGAVDRLTQEVMNSLEERKTLVVWLFDQSGSLQAQRGDILRRFERVYEELGMIEAAGATAFKRQDDKPLLTAIMAFGDKVTFRSDEPTDDIAKLKQAIAGIENDPTGVERVFQAVGMAVEKFQRYRHQAPRRNVMIVIVSDEVGDDENRLEDTVAMCRRHEMPVYVVGVPAPFGQEQSLVKYVDPDPNFDQSVQWIPVRQGPETVRPERLKLAFTGQGQRNEERIESGFGPFALTRLCVETGGIYFTVHPKKTEGGGYVSNAETAVMTAAINHFFDPSVMRRYRPDYLSLPEYDQQLNQNKARAALVQAATTSVGALENPATTFPKRDEGDLKRLLDEGQKAAARLEPKIDQLYQTLKQGEKDRPKLTQPRWQAGYDLAMGRVLAVKVRTESYNAMLAAMKAGRNFANPGSDTWVLRPADSITVGSSLEKLGKQAKELLEGIVRDHAGTPWALLAKRELETPLGWEWTETTTGVNRPRTPPPANNNAPPRPAPPPQNLPKPKPVRQNVRL